MKVINAVLVVTVFAILLCGPYGLAQGLTKTEPGLVLTTGTVCLGVGIALWVVWGLVVVSRVVVTARRERDRAQERLDLAWDKLDRIRDDYTKTGLVVPEELLVALDMCQNTGGT